MSSLNLFFITLATFVYSLNLVFCKEIDDIHSMADRRLTTTEKKTFQYHLNLLKPIIQKIINLFDCKFYFSIFKRLTWPPTSEPCFTFKPCMNIYPQLPRAQPPQPWICPSVGWFLTGYCLSWVDLIDFNERLGTNLMLSLSRTLHI